MSASREELVNLIAELESRLTSLHIVIEENPGSVMECRTCQLVHRARRVVRAERGELTVPRDTP